MVWQRKLSMLLWTRTARKLKAFQRNIQLSGEDGWRKAKIGAFHGNCGWGHRVQAWYVTLEDDIPKEYGAYADHWVAGKDEKKARSEAKIKFGGGKQFQIIQDPDVLDTWFSSGIFPLSALGWPDDTADFRAFYPTSVLETGHDIPRMVMLGMQLSGDVPFRKVYLHPMVRDASGRKMSKSLGNVIDPFEVIDGVTLENLHKRMEEGNLDPKELVDAKKGQAKDFRNGIAQCGAAALRFALVSYTAQSDKINLNIKRVVGYRKCCKWILSSLNKAISKTVTALESYEFSDAATAVYSWWKYQLCDIFMEAVKPYFAEDDEKFKYK
ncbi:hypothetical protein C5167_044471 [Papaver somniferum]|uniref:valine--tRNA ligase n=1 Tax=Papaver somniferum TaxID=3469 RepID=A0A4Y7LCG3_PAPSO|nr:hypothetical protein C5167_044471 [Papaver somniferum]